MNSKADGKPKKARIVQDFRGVNAAGPPSERLPHPLQRGPGEGGPAGATLPEPEAEGDLVDEAGVVVKASEERVKWLPWGEGQSRSGGRPGPKVEFIAPGHLLAALQGAGGHQGLVKQGSARLANPREKRGWGGDAVRREFAAWKCPGPSAGRFDLWAPLAE